MLDINQLLNPTPSEEEVQDHVLVNTLTELGRLEQSRRNQMNEDRMTAINQSNEAGNYLNTDSSGNTKTSQTQIKATLDENGRVSVTNIGTAPITQMAATVGRDNVEGLTMDNLRKRLEDIGKAPDAIEASLRRGQLMSDFSTLETNAYNTALKDAQVAQNIPALEANYKRLQMLDEQIQQQNPLKFSGPSPATVAAGNMLENSRKVADNLAKQAVGTNVNLNGMRSMLESSQKLLDQAINRQANADVKQTQREILDEQKFSDLRDATPAFAISRIKLDDPTLDDRAAVLQLNSKKTTKPEEAEAYLASSDQLPFLGIMKQNTKAEKFYIEEEFNRMGGLVDKANIKATYDEVKNLVNSKDALRREAVRIFGGAKSENYKAIEAALNDSVSILGDTKQKEEAEKLKFRAALSIVNAKATNAFRNNTASWNEPALAESISKVTSLGLQPTLENTALQFLGDTVGADRIARVKQLNNIIRNRTAKASNLTIGAVNTDAIIADLTRFYAQPSLLDKLKAITDTTTLSQPTVENARKGFGFSL